MKAIIQRVHSASVSVNNECVGKIGEGLLIFLGVFSTDTAAHADLLAKKIAKLRIFADENGKINLSLLNNGGGALVISNFTVCADTHHANRPSFSNAMESEKAYELYVRVTEQLRANGVKSVQNGKFGEHMEVSVLNNGPVNLVLDTNDWSKSLDAN